MVKPAQKALRPVRLCSTMYTVKRCRQQEVRAEGPRTLSFVYCGGPGIEVGGGGGRRGGGLVS